VKLNEIELPAGSSHNTRCGMVIVLSVNSFTVTGYMKGTLLLVRHEWRERCFFLLWNGRKTVPCIHCLHV